MYAGGQSHSCDHVVLPLQLSPAAAAEVGNVQTVEVQVVALSVTIPLVAEARLRSELQYTPVAAAVVKVASHMKVPRVQSIL